MVVTKNILEIAPAQPVKQRDPARSNGDFMKQLDQAARYRADSKQDRPERANAIQEKSDDNKCCEKKVADSPKEEAKSETPVAEELQKTPETEMVEEPLEEKKDQPEVFAAIPMIMANEIADVFVVEQQSAVIDVATGISIEPINELNLEVNMPVVDAQQPVKTEVASFVELMHENAQTVLQNENGQIASAAKEVLEQPVNILTDADTMDTEPDVQQQKAGTKTVAVEQAAQPETMQFVKQVVQEMDAKLKQEVDTTPKAMPSTTNVELETAVEKPAMMQGNDDSDNAATKQKEIPVLQHPLTAPIAQDGKVDFKMSMQELQPQEQQLLKQNVQTQIIDQVRSLVTQEKTEFYLQLKPEHLGGLSIMLAAGEKGLVAKLMTASKDVHMMLQNDMTQIQESLKERGITIVQMEVVYDQMASTTGKQNTNDGQGWEANGSPGSQGRVLEDIIEGGSLTYDELSNYDILAEQGGSVEFSA